MDEYRLKELAYKAEQGKTPRVDGFELRELIETANSSLSAEGEISSLTSKLSDIRRESKSLSKQIKLVFDTLEFTRSTLNANDDLPECFITAFGENLANLKKLVDSIDEINDLIEEYTMEEI